MLSADGDVFGGPAAEDYAFRPGFGGVSGGGGDGFSDERDYFLCGEVELSWC